MQRRALEAGTLALEVASGGGAGVRVHKAAWGSRKAKRDAIEECVPLGDGVALTWLRHE